MSETLIVLLALNIVLDIVLLKRVSVVRAKFDALETHVNRFMNYVCDYVEGKNLG